jgi:hypothetical protein
MTLQNEEQLKIINNLSFGIQTYTLKDEAQTALFEEPVRTAL